MSLLWRMGTNHVICVNVWLQCIQWSHKGDVDKARDDFLDPLVKCEKEQCALDWTFQLGDE